MGKIRDVDQVVGKPRAAGPGEAVSVHVAPVHVRVGGPRLSHVHQADPGAAEAGQEPRPGAGHDLVGPVEARSLRHRVVGVEVDGGGAVVRGHIDRQKVLEIGRPRERIAGPHLQDVAEVLAQLDRGGVGVVAVPVADPQHGTEPVADPPAVEQHPLYVVDGYSPHVAAVETEAVGHRRVGLLAEVPVGDENLSARYVRDPAGRQHHAAGKPLVEREHRAPVLREAELGVEMVDDRG